MEKGLENTKLVIRGLDSVVVVNGYWRIMGKAKRHKKIRKELKESGIDFKKKGYLVHESGVFTAQPERRFYKKKKKEER